MELEDETDGAVAETVEGRPLEGEDILPVEPYRPRGRPVESTEDMHEGGLAGSRGADHADPFPPFDAQIDPAQHLHAPIRGAETLV